MLLIRTITVIALTNIVIVLSSIKHHTEELDINKNQEIPVEQVKNVRHSFLFGGKHDVEQIDNTEFEVLLLL